MFNNVIITGRLTADPELKKTESGLSLCVFTIANEIGYGEKKTAHFIPVVAWKNQAEVVAKYFKKGNLIGIEGQLQMHKYKDKEGKSHTTYEVVASSVQFIDSKSSREAEQNVSISNDTEMFETVSSLEEQLPF